jgi:hypothetical protein
VLDDGGTSARFAWSAVHLRARDQADRLFDLAFEDFQSGLKERLKGRKISLQRLKLTLRTEFLRRVDRLDRDVRELAMLKVPRGTPINLYANLGPQAMAQAALAHIRYRHDPRALAQALLTMSECPDLVEDSGHIYGCDLTTKQKEDLIEFLKTF